MKRAETILATSGSLEGVRRLARQFYGFVPADLPRLEPIEGRKPEQWIVCNAAGELATRVERRGKRFVFVLPGGV